MIKVWSWRRAVQKSDLPALTKLVMFNLANYMNDAGQQCYPTTRQQALDCSLSERSVCTHLETAQQTGFIIKKNYGFNGRGWARNEYHAAMPEGTEPDSAPYCNNEQDALNVVQHVEDEALNVVQEGTEPDDIKALNVVQLNSSYNSSLNTPLVKGSPLANPKPLKKGKLEYTPAFEELWKAWQPFEMQPGDKQDAMKSYAKALKSGTTPETILTAAKAYCFNCEKLRCKTKHVVTWLNKGSFDIAENIPAYSTYIDTTKPESAIV